MQQLSDASEDEDDKNNSTSRNINLGPSGNPHAKPTDFDFLKVIGKGSFGKVFLAKRKHDEKYYAVKVLQKRVILNRKELFFHLQRERTFPEPRAKFYIAEMASALGYLHSLNIVYRDLKPENILLDHEGHIILTDFGLCKEGISQTDTTTTFCGTPEYLAPEVLRKQPYDNTVDWWCLGSVLYEMLFGLPPFYSRDTHEMYDNILHKPLAMRPGASSTAWSLLQGLLEKDGPHRLGSRDDFNEIKAHSFFSSINWDELVQKKIPPPFTPNVSSYCDISNFDPEFTDEMVPNSVCWSQDHSIVNASVMEADDAFVGFSYAPPSDDSFL
uniref:Serum/glucocorticoid regulated kinase family member 3 n=1 Tax=Dicentrarchus labrax TaxID=13489 RepID=A0A8C4DI96_DICLA